MRVLDTASESVSLRSPDSPTLAPRSALSQSPVAKYTSPVKVQISGEATEALEQSFNNLQSLDGPFIDHEDCKYFMEQLGLSKDSSRGDLAVMKMDLDGDGRVGRSDFIGFMGQILLDVQRDYTKSPGDNSAPGPFMTQQLKDIKARARKVRKRNVRVLDPQLKLKVLRVIAISDLELLEKHDLLHPWDKLKLDMTDAKARLVWQDFLAHHEADPLSGQALKLSETVLRAVEVDAAAGREQARNEMEMHKLRNEQLMQQARLERFSTASDQPSGKCRTCQGCIVC